MPKKKQPGKHLQFYMDCINKEKMPFSGLCRCAEEDVISDEILELMRPIYDSHLDGGRSTYFWASGKPNYSWHRGKFTELRQTIVLFMACLNNEL